MVSWKGLHHKTIHCRLLAIKVCPPNAFPWKLSENAKKEPESSIPWILTTFRQSPSSPIPFLFLWKREERDASKQVSNLDFIDTIWKLTNAPELPFPFREMANQIALRNEWRCVSKGAEHSKETDAVHSSIPASLVNRVIKSKWTAAAPFYWLNYMNKITDGIDSD